MANNQGLTVEQEDALVAAMLRAGVDRGTAESVLVEARRLLGYPAPPRSVTVSQQADVVEAGAVMIGLKADRIG